MNDISFIYTKKPVPHKSGIPYSYSFSVGQKVFVAGYHNHQVETQEAHIIGSNVLLTNGEAQLKENLVLDIYLSPGTSGSAVLDERGNLLGMVILSGTLKGNSGNLIASIALPVRTLAKALERLDPTLASAVFTEIPEEKSSIEQTPAVRYQDDDLREDNSPVTPRLSLAPGEAADSVRQLRVKSRAASTRMANFVAKQCLAQGSQKPLCHELAVIGGQQTFREINRHGDLAQPTEFFPVQKNGVWTESDWADTLGEIADNPWLLQGSIDDRHLFAFRSVPEDGRCYWEEHSKRTSFFGGGQQLWKGPVACFEQVLTDKDFNVLWVFTELRPPEGCLTELVQIATYYDWINLAGSGSPVLLPVTQRITAKVLGQRDLWYAKITWTEYQEFRVLHKVKY